MSGSFDPDLTAEQIGRALAADNEHPPPDTYPRGFFQRDPREAAVLIPFLRGERGWEVLFIRRAHNEQDRHSGQVAFPGGRRDPGDADLVATALRESEEELGLAADAVEVLGHLNPYRTISNYLVTPVVGQIRWPYPLRPDPIEVGHWFTVPLVWLADHSNHQVRPREIPDWDHSIGVVYFDRYEGELLWGVTARITLSLLKVLGALRTT